jgi:2-oxoglutarate/2-oxoacid ferredoxin oxidoreductase subunit beta
LPDGSKITLTKLNHDYDPTDRLQALQILQKAETEGHFYTGLIYHDEHCATFEDQLKMVDEPLATLPAERIRPRTRSSRRSWRRSSNVSLKSLS